MKNNFSKIKIIYVFVGLLILLGNREIQGQEKKPLNLNDIAVKLTFTSRIGKSTEQINKKLTEDVRRRKVDFILEPDGEKLLRNAGANDLLIRAIRESLPEEIERELPARKEKTDLYKKYIDNYKETFEQKKTALAAAREFIERYKDCPEAQTIIKYFKQSISALEQQINIYQQKQSQ